MPKGIPASLALHIAGMDKFRFADAVKRGLYPCAPALRGNTRHFDVPSLLALGTYRVLLDLGVVPRLAGGWACQAERIAREDWQEMSGPAIIHFAVTSGPSYVSFNGTPPSVPRALGTVMIDLLEIKDVMMARLKDVPFDQAQRLETVFGLYQDDITP